MSENSNNNNELNKDVVEGSAENTAENAKEKSEGSSHSHGHHSGHSHHSHHSHHGHHSHHRRKKRSSTNHKKGTPEEKWASFVSFLKRNRKLITNIAINAVFVALVIFIAVMWDRRTGHVPEIPETDTEDRKSVV